MTETTLTPISNFLTYFPEFDRGRPIAGGQVYIGEPDFDPEVVANQKDVTLIQENGDTVAATQPVILSAGGVPTYNGSPARMQFTGNYSLKVLSAQGAQVYYIPNYEVVNQGINSLVPSSAAVAAGESVITVPTYVPNVNTSVYFLNSNVAVVGVDIEETDSTTLTLTSAVETDSTLYIYRFNSGAINTAAASNVSDSTRNQSAQVTLDEMQSFPELGGEVSPVDTTKPYGNILRYYSSAHTDHTAAAENLYASLAGVGGGKAIWPKQAYTLSDTVYFPTNTETDLCRSTVTSTAAIAFATGYLSGGSVIANISTGNNVDESVFRNGTIDCNDGIAFRLSNFRYGSAIKNIVFLDVAQAIVGDTCFYSGYEDLIFFGAADRVKSTAGVTLGSPTIVVTNADADDLAAGMDIITHFTPMQTTISSIGAADSGGAGFTNVVLSNNADQTASAGAANTGYVASLNPKAMYEFGTACSDMSFTKVSAGSKMYGFQLTNVLSTTFNSCDVENCGLGFRIMANSTNLTFNSTHTETIMGWVWDFSECTSNGEVYINGLHSFNVAGLITAGASGFVSGTANFPQVMDSYTPYGFGDNSEPFIDLNSANAKMVVTGFLVGHLSLGNPPESMVMNRRGIYLPNNESANEQTLDWYEEGTFTPTIVGATAAGAGTYSIQTGNFTRIGNRVFFDLRIVWSAHTGTGNMQVGGWPYEAINQLASMPITGYDITATAGKQLSARFGPSSYTLATVQEYGNSAAATNVAIDTAGQLYINGSYEVA